MPVAPETAAHKADSYLVQIVMPVTVLVEAEDITAAAQVTM